MLYEYYTDSTRKLQELGRLFVEIHKKESGKNCLLTMKNSIVLIESAENGLQGKSLKRK